MRIGFVTDGYIRNELAFLVILQFVMIPEFFPFLKIQGDSFFALQEELGIFFNFKSLRTLLLNASLDHGVGWSLKALITKLRSFISTP